MPRNFFRGIFIDYEVVILQLHWTKRLLYRHFTFKILDYLILEFGIIAPEDLRVYTSSQPVDL